MIMLVLTTKVTNLHYKSASVASMILTTECSNDAPEPEAPAPGGMPGGMGGMGGMY